MFVFIHPHSTSGPLAPGTKLKFITISFYKMPTLNPLSVQANAAAAESQWSEAFPGTGRLAWEGAFGFVRRSRWGPCRALGSRGPCLAGTAAFKVGNSTFGFPGSSNISKPPEDWPTLSRHFLWLTMCSSGVAAQLCGGRAPGHRPQSHRALILRAQDICPLCLGRVDIQV